MQSSRFLITLSSVATFLLCGCTMTLTNGYQFDFKGEKEARQMEVEIPANTTSLDLRNVHGDIEITPSADGTVGLLWELTCWADTQSEAARQIERIQLLASEEGGTFKCEIQLPTEEKDLLRGVKSVLKLQVPASMDVYAKNSHGNIKASDVDCRLNLVGGHGMLHASRLTQPLTLKNSHGAVTVEDVVSATIKASHADTTVSMIHENLDVESSHGSIDARNITGNIDAKTSHDDIKLTNISGLVTAEASHGNINATGLQGDWIKLESSFGDIDVSTTAASVECQNQHGDITITVPSAGLNWLSGNTSFGDLTLILPPECRPVLDTSVTFGEVDSEIESASSGSPPVELKVRHGNINVRRLQGAEKE